MKKTQVIMLIILSSLASFAQDKGKFSFEFGGGGQEVNMGKLNQYYIDSIAKPQGIFKDHIKSTNHGFCGVRYQPAKIFDIGLYGSLQRTEQKGNPTFYTSDEIGNATVNYGTSNLLIQSIGFGITSNIHVNYILKWHKKEGKFLNRSRLLAEFRLGCAMSNASIKIHYPTLDPIASSYARFSSNSADGQAALKFEYDYLKRSLVSSIGFKAGYSFSKTKTLLTPYDDDWKVLNDKTINLNFSGWFASVYLVFAK